MEKERPVPPPPIVYTTITEIKRNNKEAQRIHLLELDNLARTEEQKYLDALQDCKPVYSRLEYKKKSIQKDVRLKLKKLLRKTTGQVRKSNLEEDGDEEIDEPIDNEDEVLEDPPEEDEDDVDDIDLEAEDPEAEDGTDPQEEDEERAEDPESIEESVDAEDGEDNVDGEEEGEDDEQVQSKKKRDDEEMFEDSDTTTTDVEDEEEEDDEDISSVSDRKTPNEVLREFVKDWKQFGAEIVLSPDKRQELFTFHTRKLPSGKNINSLIF